MSKINVRRVRDILHESIIAIEQITLNVHRGKLWFFKVIRQPKKTQFYHIQVNKSFKWPNHNKFNKLKQLNWTKKKNNLTNIKYYLEY